MSADVPTAGQAAPADVSPSRRAAVDRARQAWVSRLIDLSQRNNLLYYRQLKVGTLDLTAADRDVLAELLSGKTVAASKLLPGSDRVKLAAQVKEIARKARENFEERGLETLFLAAGMATWKGEEGKRDPQSAVLLVPVVVNARDRAGPALKRNGEPLINPVLLQVLSTNFRVDLKPDEVLAAADTDPDRDDDPFDLDALLAKLDELCRGVAGFGVRRTVVLGNFTFQKMAMVRDLRELGERLARSDVIAGLAGDVDAQQRILGAGPNGPAPEPDPHTFDQVPPQGEFLILDTDSSQHKAIAIATSGRSTVIQGPPGTGKSQVIANLIVTAAAQGKRVLFVAEKRAALQVVLDRLARAGLGHLALDLHGADTSRKIIAGRMREALDYIAKGEPVFSEAILYQFEDRRKRLNAHAERLHKPRQPSGMSVFQLQSRLLPRKGDMSLFPLKTRFRGATLLKLDANVVAEVKDLLAQAADLGPLFLGTDPSPWAKATYTEGHAVQAAIDLATKLADETWPGAKQTMLAALAPVRTAPPTTVAETEQLLAVAAEVDQILTSYTPTLFNGNLPDLASALAPAERGGFARFIASIFSGRYKRARQAIAQHATSPKTPQQMLIDMRKAAELLKRWREARFDSPTPVASNAASAHQVAQQVRAQLATLSSGLGSDDLSKLPFEPLESRLSALRDDTLTPRRIPSLRKVMGRLTELGLDPLVSELREQGRGNGADEPSISSAPTEPSPQPSPGVPGEGAKPNTGSAGASPSLPLAPSTWPAALEQAWLRSCLDHALAEDPELASFSGQVHNRFVAEFAELDRQRLKLAAKRVAARHVREAMKVLSGLGAQSAVVRREAEKKMRHLPFRKLMDQAPDVLAAMFPCFMCSPLSVSQLLPGERALFDIVIFDEASQVLPEDAVPSLMRGAQAVVAGDQHQLPPTPFFADAGEDEEADTAAREVEAEATEGFESLLSMMSAFVPAPMLQWHYRSRDERLITFSNQHIYGGKLVTFPSPGGIAAVEHVLVTPSPLRGERAGVRGETSDDDDGSEVEASTPHPDPLPPGGERESARDGSSSAEVDRVIELVLRHAERELQKPDPAQRRSLGVIALGIPHARRIESAIERALEDREDLEDYFDPAAPERFFVQNLERVQGDERDVIILTLGVASDRAGGRVPLTRFGPLNNRENGYRRLNVAITRARYRMIIVSSFAHAAIDSSKEMGRGIELLRYYLEYAAKGGRLPEGAGGGAAAGEFEADIAEALSAHHVNTAPHWGASGDRIDLVAMHPRDAGRCVLAIECDGPGYHAAPTARDRDRLRQQQLEALGWRFHRVWSTDWFTRREQEVRRALTAYEAAAAQADQLTEQTAKPSAQTAEGAKNAKEEIQK